MSLDESNMAGKASMDLIRRGTEHPTDLSSSAEHIKSHRWYSEALVSSPN